eukprot:COSAG01_NODE_19152_length_1027_cov_2.288793_2_plen_72_part_01
MPWLLAGTRKGQVCKDRVGSRVASVARARAAAAVRGSRQAVGRRCHRPCKLFGGGCECWVRGCGVEATTRTC